MADYKGSVTLISGLTQANNGNFPLIDASAVNFKIDTNGQIVPKEADASDRLDTLLSRLTKKVDSLPTSVPTSLPNPHPLIINGQIYDGSREITMTIDGITFDDIEAQDWLLKCGDSAGKENSITN